MISRKAAVGYLWVGALAFTCTLCASRSTKGNINHPTFYTPLGHPYGLTLYNKDGDRVATCGDMVDTSLGDCKIEAKFTLDDVMNAWLNAYTTKPEQ